MRGILRIGWIFEVGIFALVGMANVAFSTTIKFKSNKELAISLIVDCRNSYKRFAKFCV